MVTETVRSAAGRDLRWKGWTDGCCKAKHNASLALLFIRLDEALMSEMLLSVLGKTLLAQVVHSVCMTRLCEHKWHGWQGEMDAVTSFTGQTSRRAVGCWWPPALGAAPHTALRS